MRPSKPDSSKDKRIAELDKKLKKQLANTKGDVFCKTFFLKVANRFSRLLQEEFPDFGKGHLLAKVNKEMVALQACVFI